jgi:hypothetical protein
LPVTPYADGKLGFAARRVWFTRPERRLTMELEAAYPIVVTDKLAECRDFYTHWLGFQVVFEATWFAYLKPSDESPHGIAFMSPDHPSQPPGPEVFNGDGVLLDAAGQRCGI